MFYWDSPFESHELTPWLLLYFMYSPPVPSLLRKEGVVQEMYIIDY